MEIFGGKVKSTFPVGSLSMELNFYRKNEPELLKDIDLLIIGINPVIGLKFQIVYLKILLIFKLIKDFQKK